VWRQTGKGLIDQLQQAHAVTFKTEPRAEQLQAAMLRPRRSLAEWIDALLD
jgi:hypothetical protein